ncbi:unnamed protein product [Prunus armeniaca]
MGKKSKSKTPKVMQDNIAVGIGGSFLDPEAIETARGRQLHFLANVDPIDVARNITGLNPETTLEMASFSSPPRLPKGLRLRLSLVDCNKTPNTAEQIGTELRGPPPTPSPALSPEPTISPYPASPVPPSTIQGTSTSSSMSIPRFWNSSKLLTNFSS